MRFSGQQTKEDFEENSENLYTFSLLLTSLLVLAVYVLIGAYFYSKRLNIPLVDAVFICYQLLSGTKLPDSIAPRKEQLSGVYKLISAEPESKLKELIGKTVEQNVSLESFIWQSIYLLCGLNLISMCANYFTLWCQNTQLDPNPAESQESIDEMSATKLCNGHLPTLMGSLESQHPQLDSLHRPLVKGEQFQMNQLVEPAQLADLFVLNQQVQQAQTDNFVPARIAVGQNQTLCLHHQAQMSDSNSNSNSHYSPAIYHEQHPKMHQQHHLSHQQLYLNQQQLSEGAQLELELDEDDDQEMDQMLKSCLDQGKLRSSSSSNHLSQSSQQKNGAFLHFHKPIESLQRLQQLDANGYEHDSSLNTNSNTISSASSRTVRVGQQQQICNPTQIGFVIDRAELNQN